MRTSLEEKALEEALRQELLADTSSESLLQTLRQYKASGGGQPDALRALERLRAIMPDEVREDIVLDLMDFVTGFCSPHRCIWE